MRIAATLGQPMAICSNVPLRLPVGVARYSLYNTSSPAPSIAISESHFRHLLLCQMTSRNVSILVVLIYTWRVSTNIKKADEFQDVYYGPFDKILSKFHTTLVKFDIAYPYGAKHEAFLEVAESSKHRPDFLVAEVGVKDYGERDNEDLAKRFNLDSKEFPVYLLFAQGVKEPYTYKGTTDDDYSAEKVINFVRSKDTGIWIGAVGCLQDFDRLAKCENNVSILVVLIYTWRVSTNIKKADEFQDVYYGVQIAYIAIIGTQVFMIILSIVLLMGVLKVSYLQRP
ncbi:protein windbeutel-like, partial [Diaphorina citri]|uniref:Protein windbeutel-like n=1 Tax=Diaphorina citri TaxID=121845 RepID=A0A3Q0JC90_DIACI